MKYFHPMEKRSGGTVAFICDGLWQAISSILSSVVVRTSSMVKDSKKTGKIVLSTNGSQ